MPGSDQHVPGLTSPCCVSMRTALSCGYIKVGYLWGKPNSPRWSPWKFNIETMFVRDVTPIHFCPFCGTDLDSE